MNLIGVTEPKKLPPDALRNLFEVVLCVGVLAFTTNAQAANWYVRSTQQGANNGTDWNNAWSLGTINWLSVAAGDTIWLAGGAYSDRLHPNKSGASGNPIYIKRVLSTDSVPTSAAGWTSGFDSQVVIQPPGTSPISWSGNNQVGSWVVIDGRINYGIKAKCPDLADGFAGAVSFGYACANVHDVTLTHLDLAGPATDSSGYNFAGNIAGINFHTWDGGSYAPISNVVTNSCAIHGFPNLLMILGQNTHHLTFEYCDFYDNNSASPNIHANMCYLDGTHDVIFRYNKVHAWQVEGIGFGHATNPLNWYIYGNVWYDQLNPVATCFWMLSTGTNGPVYLYNNTFYNVTITSGQARSQQFSSSSQSRNNTYWASSWNNGSKIADEDYNFSSGSTAGSHSINNGSNPFVNPAVKDFHIISTVGATYPRNNGVSLGSPYGADMDGRARGADGAWDIGAYEYGGGPAPTPTPTPTPTATRTPTPTPTATPTATIVDFNGDGKPDYVLYNAGTQQTAVWYLNNNLYIGGAFTPTLPAGWIVVSAADFNRDGHPDYALFRPSTRQTVIWYFSGVTRIGSTYGPTPPGGWALVATGGDFNSDGKPDYVLYNASTRQTVVWYLNNNVYIGGAFTPSLPAGWSVVGVADFNRDGKSDYLLFNPSTRQTAIFYLAGTTWIGTASGPTPPAGWSLVGVADFNRDGKPDYLLFNASTRQTVIWYMNNNVRIGGAYGPTLPAGWTVAAP